MTTLDVNKSVDSQISMEYIQPMYVKLFGSVFDGTLRGRSKTLLVWINILARADREGFFDRHFRSICDETGLSIEEVKEAIRELESPDSESRSKELAGRRLERIDEHREWGWRCVNYAKYRDIKNEEERREYNRVAQRKYRAKQSGEPDEPESPSQVSVEVSQAEPVVPQRRGFEKPTVEQVGEEMEKRGMPRSEAQGFIDYYESKGWVVGKAPMKSWKAAVGTFKKFWDESPKRKSQPSSKVVTPPRVYKLDANGNIDIAAAFAPPTHP